MTFRIILDYGDLEVTVYHTTSLKDDDSILAEAIESIKERGLVLPPEEWNNTVVEPAMGWDEE